MERYKEQDELEKIENEHIKNKIETRLTRRSI